MGHGAVHHVKGASQGAGAARVSPGAHHMALVTRSQVRAIWRQPGRIRCGSVNVLLLLAHGERRPNYPMAKQESSVWWADSKPTAQATR